MYDIRRSVSRQAYSDGAKFAGHPHILAAGRWSRRHTIKGRMIPDVLLSLPGKRSVTNNSLPGSVTLDSNTNYLIINISLLSEIRSQA
jgi:hypothetical protein